MTARGRTVALATAMLALAPFGATSAGAPAPGGALAAQVRPAPQRRELEQRFHQRFLDLSRKRLELQESQTERLGSILERGFQARRQLQADLEAERVRFAEAIADANTSDDEFLRRLAAMEGLRRREYELWRSEQQALAEFMTPRQRAMFVQMQLRMNDAVRDARRRPPHGGPGRDDGGARDDDRRDEDRPGGDFPGPGDGPRF